MGFRVLGVDACKAGWAGIVLADGAARTCLAATIGDLAEQAKVTGPLDLIAIDMPIGLPDVGRRQADVLARKLAGPRWASVFMTPVRAALEEEDYVAATSVNLERAGERISRQAHGLRPRFSRPAGGYGTPRIVSSRCTPRSASPSWPVCPWMSAGRRGRAWPGAGNCWPGQALSWRGPGPGGREGRRR
jgi:Protein of unknown function (DUF429)